MYQIWGCWWNGRTEVRPCWLEGLWRQHPWRSFSPGCATSTVPSTCGLEQENKAEVSPDKTEGDETLLDNWQCIVIIIIIVIIIVIIYLVPQSSCWLVCHSLGSQSTHYCKSPLQIGIKIKNHEMDFCIFELYNHTTFVEMLSVVFYFCQI